MHFFIVSSQSPGYGYIRGSILPNWNDASQNIAFVNNEYDFEFEFWIWICTCFFSSSLSVKLLHRMFRALRCVRHLYLKFRGFFHSVFFLWNCCIISFARAFFIQFPVFPRNPCIILFARFIHPIFPWICCIIIILFFVSVHRVRVYPRKSSAKLKRCRIAMILQRLLPLEQCKNQEKWWFEPSIPDNSSD